ncbi:uncharacterized protein VICG_01022 [Vittaforma corneae ATCC 50505]|uniref:PHD-type domain-containing protein n=1 Tax=Vittaforma corneae (strain ATCC 50505) TaxID=993615 RepID=L2GNC9_VITCO|nr:uncharacterized protein VICG_01022 [Vittaforma corneae ATCC 50505]ELA42005.1 hypothetical protein VICG_01022 [Vittaforma corneae ATCC 50505]
MTPMDVFDSMLESIQQFPLECSNFERHIKRLNKDQFKYSILFDKMIQRLISPQDPKLLKVERKLRKIVKKKIELTNNFQNAVEKQQQKLEELVKISNIDMMNFNFSPLSGNIQPVIKLSSIPQGNGKYCICNDKAFGNMICCDNPACAIKWYHFRCVNLIISPRTTWTCPRCSAMK